MNAPNHPSQHPTALTLADQLRQAARSAHGVHFVNRHEEEETFSYRELLTEAQEVAGALHHLGLRPGARAAIILPTSPLFFHAFFGCVLAGVIPVPLYPPVRLGKLSEYHRRTAQMIQVSGCQVILTDHRIRRILGHTTELARPPMGCRTVEELRAEPWAGVAAKPDSIAFVQFSSGTTMDPKPVALTHRQVLANTQAILSAVVAQYPEDDTPHRGVSWLPLYHDMGLIGCVISGLVHPGTLTLIPPEAFVARPALWLRAISRHRATISPAPNFAYALCVDRITDDEMEGVDLSSWKVALNGAEPVTPAVLERFVERFSRWGLPQEALTPVYGLAEAALAVTFSNLGSRFRWQRFDREQLSHAGAAIPDALGQPLVSLGRPLPGFDLEIRSQEGEVAAPGELGHVWVRGPSIMQGYLDQPEKTERALVNGWLNTGDLGFLFEGELYLFGRAKDVIILRGRNYAPQDIEQVIDGVPGVRVGCVAAVGVLQEESEVLLLLVERQKDAPADDTEIMNAVRRRVAQETSLVPDEVVVLAPGTLPRTSSGKIQRQRAAALWLEGKLAAPQPVTPTRMMGHLVSSQIAYVRAKWSGAKREP